MLWLLQLLPLALPQMEGLSDRLSGHVQRQQGDFSGVLSIPGRAARGIRAASPAVLLISDTVVRTSAASM